ncbi:putative membrane protein YdjX (TVP38/TMEM64 family) [Dysgonomonas sp. PH5-45]|uniref:DUF2752 domain-containing protein n=1 Tax=unclassified Dysgonomonas TaxID=2630389 RepID=UPI002475D54D|nr:MULTISPECIES: DUF2752 domain-containing protein [unclassified Dysgonomonas]MDH6354462.1 putative membrane protein YdjX (TVP38/TMEM64 family) [Dysgonomonas sp. PH5-45]MDH6387361.1 putative membrane protein YdjX (TVP38/TMEM64 family) [Dysgonomonas sp. PH5-37]
MTKKTIVYTAATLALLILCFVYYFIYNPAGSSNWALKCTFHELTSFHCPGCGGQRAIHYLLHGEIMMALRSNIVYVIGLPFIIYLYYFCVDVYVLGNKDRLNNFLLSTRTAIIVIIIVVIFFIVRNIPLSPFTFLTPP